MNILVVEDDLPTAREVAKAFLECGLRVTSCENATQAREALASAKFDLMVLDINLPGESGLSILSDEVYTKSKLPVLILSAKSELEDRLQGFGAGVDDYLVKPFSMKELLYRAQAILRRSKAGHSPSLLKFADLTLNVTTREVQRNGKRISLQTKEFVLLLNLMEHPGVTMTKGSILKSVFDYSFEPQTNVVDVLVHRLRAKVDKDFEPKLISTVKGVGYALKIK